MAKRSNNVANPSKSSTRKAYCSKFESCINCILAILVECHNFERKLAKGIREDSKSFWRYFPAKKKCPTKVGLLKEGDRVIEKSEDMAEHLNSYFQSVFTQEPIGPVPYAEPRTDFKMPNISITVDMVLAQLPNLRVDKAAGPDGIPSLFLKLAAQGLNAQITLQYKPHKRASKLIVTILTDINACNNNISINNKRGG